MADAHTFVSMYKFNGKCKQYTWIGGPMGSKKSIELIAEILRHGFGPSSKSSIQLAIKPSLDTRLMNNTEENLSSSSAIAWSEDSPIYPYISNKKGYIESRMGIKYPCVMLSNSELLPFLSIPEVLRYIDIFAFDEMQFFDKKKEAVAFLLNNGKIVITAGLDSNYLGEPFNGYTDLVAWATDVRKFKATCAQCGNFDAVHSQRLVNDNNLIVIGNDKYEARCSGCFFPRL